MGRSDICGSRVGTSFQSQRWLALDPCGLVCITLSVSVHIFALVVIALKLVSVSLLSQVVFLGLYIPMAFLALCSLFMAWTTDPGAVPMGAKPLTTFRRSGSTAAADSRKRAIRRCHKCNDNFKPARAHHDSVTGRCIVKMDHFCPWVCNAIGAMNHKFFVLFIGYTLCTSILSIILIAISMVRCGYMKRVSHASNASGSHPAATDDWENDTTPDKNAYYNPSRWLQNQSDHEECHGLYDQYLVALLLVVSIIFLCFTCCMLVEQLDAIESNTGKIARMKMSVGEGGTELSRVTHAFNEMFGGDSPNVAWHWFLPLPVKFPKGMEPVVLGYDWDESFEAVPYREGGSNLEEQEDKLVPAVVGDEKEQIDFEKGLIAEEPTVTLEEHAVIVVAPKKKRGMRKRETSPAFVDNTNGRLT